MKKYWHNSWCLGYAELYTTWLLIWWYRKLEWWDTSRPPEIPTIKINRLLIRRECSRMQVLGLRLHFQDRKSPGNAYWYNIKVIDLVRIVSPHRRVVIRRWRPCVPPTSSPYSTSFGSLETVLLTCVNLGDLVWYNKNIHFWRNGTWYKDQKVAPSRPTYLLIKW